MLMMAAPGSRWGRAASDHIYAAPAVAYGGDDACRGFGIFQIGCDREDLGEFGQKCVGSCDAMGDRHRVIGCEEQGWRRARQVLPRPKACTAFLNMGRADKA